MKRMFHNTIVRYLFAIATVACTFAFRIWLTPFTGTGAPFVLFFATVLVTSMVGGVGPGICALLISLPLAMQIAAPFGRNSFVSAGAQRLQDFLFDELFQLFANLLAHVLLDGVWSECFLYVTLLVIVVHASSSSAARLGGSFGFF
jgi:K+-sensing histidine kinase KdpD